MINGFNETGSKHIAFFRELYVHWHAPAKVDAQWRCLIRDGQPYEMVLSLYCATRSISLHKKDKASASAKTMINEHFPALQSALLKSLEKNELPPRELALLIWSIARLKLDVDEQFMERLVANIYKNLPDFYSEDITMTFSSFAKMRREPGPGLILAQRASARSNLHIYSREEFNDFAWSFSRLGIPVDDAAEAGDEIMPHWISKLKKRIIDLKSSQLSLHLWAIAKQYDLKPDPALRTLAQRIYNKLDLPTIRVEKQVEQITEACEYFGWTHPYNKNSVPVAETAGLAVASPG